MSSILDSTSTPRHLLPRTERVHDLSGKYCKYCKTYVSLSEFDADAATADGFTELCRECTHAWEEKSQERNWRYNLKRLYGMTVEQFNEMAAAQNGVCAICHEPPLGTKYRRLHIDHDHTTGRTRGLLCNDCNIAVGYMKDSPERMIAAAEYLQRDGK